MTLLQALTKGQYLTFLKILVSGGLFGTTSNGDNAVNMLAELSQIANTFFIAPTVIQGTTAALFEIFNPIGSEMTVTVLSADIQGDVGEFEIHKPVTDLQVAGGTALASTLSGALNGGTMKSILTTHVDYNPGTARRIGRPYIPSTSAKSNEVKEFEGFEIEEGEGLLIRTVGTGRLRPRFKIQELAKV